MQRKHSQLNENDHDLHHHHTQLCGVIVLFISARFISITEKRLVCQPESVARTLFNLLEDGYFSRDSFLSLSLCIIII